MLQERFPDVFGTHVQAQTGKLGGDSHKNLALIFDFAFCRHPLRDLDLDSGACFTPVLPNFVPTVLPKVLPNVTLLAFDLVVREAVFGRLVQHLARTTHAAS